MAFLALGTADILDRNTILCAVFQIVMEFLVNAVEFVTAGTVVIEINFGLAVTVYAPTHAQLSELFHFIHCGDLTVAGLALNFTGADVL